MCGKTGEVARAGDQRKNFIYYWPYDSDARYGGVVPELASRAHILNVVPVVQAALDRAGVSLAEIDGIAVTNAPGLVGALLVGLQTAKALAWATGKPLVGVHHLEGHLTAIYLEPELEVLLKLEVLRQKRPMAEIVREAVQAYVTRKPRQAPPGAGAFASGRADTAERAEDVLAETGFGAAPPAAPTARKKKR